MHHIAEEVLYALLMELVMLTERHKIAEQHLAVDAHLPVADFHRFPVRLMGDKTIGFQQITNQRFSHQGSAGGALKLTVSKGIVIDANRLIVHPLAVKNQHPAAGKLVERAQRDRHLAVGSAGEILDETVAPRFA